LTTRTNGLTPPVAARSWPLLVAVAATVFLAGAKPAQAEPLFTFSPETPLTNEAVTFTSGAPGDHTWGFDPDLLCNDAKGQTAQHSWPLAGSFYVRLCVTDGSHYLTDTALVVVRNRPPVASFTYAPQAPLAGDRIALTSISADPDGPIAAQAWDLDGDGAFDDGSGPTAEWSFPTAGNFPVRLLVTDTNGESALAALMLTVLERPPDQIAPFPLVRMLAEVGQAGTRIRELVVRAPAGARVLVRCRGGGCPRRSFVIKARLQARAARIIRIHRFRKHRLRPGAMIEIRVTKRGEIGKFTRFRIRAGKPPTRTDRCILPASRRPVRCP
jgi:PKD domain-containing protein